MREFKSRICVDSEYVQRDALVVTVCMYVQPVHGAHHRRRVDTDARATSSLIRSQSESPAGAAARCPRCVEDFIASVTSREAAGETIYAATFDAAPCLQFLFVTPRAVLAMRLMNGLAPSLDCLTTQPI